MPLRDDDLRPMTPEEVAWVRAQRVPGIEPEECKVPGVAQGMCAYSGPDGMDACGDVCIYRPARIDGPVRPSDDEAGRTRQSDELSQPGEGPGPLIDGRAARSITGIEMTDQPWLCQCGTLNGANGICYACGARHGERWASSGGGRNMADRTPGAYDFAAAIFTVRDQYPADVFPPDSDSPDAKAGTWARLVCDQIVAEAHRRADARIDGEEG